VVGTYRNPGMFFELSQDWDGKVGLGNTRFFYKKHTI